MLNKQHHAIKILVMS